MFSEEAPAASVRPQISTPFNPVHITHVGYDNEQGEFTVIIVVNTGTARPMVSDDKRIRNI